MESKVLSQENYIEMMCVHSKIVYARPCHFNICIIISYACIQSRIANTSLDISGGEGEMEMREWLRATTMISICMYVINAGSHLLQWCVKKIVQIVCKG